MLEEEVSLGNEKTPNIETTIEEKDVVVDSMDEILLQEEENLEEIEIESNYFIKELLVGMIDQIIVSSVALITLLLLNLVLKLFGYHIVEKQPMFLIIYVIINIIYPPICKKVRLKETIGRKVLLNK